jgi:hypothetical protein
MKLRRRVDEKSKRGASCKSDQGSESNLTGRRYRTPCKPRDY